MRPSWVHTDLRGDNLIAEHGRLAAVIDWEGCTVGDPSADHLAAWWLFDGASRETFRIASGAGKDTWLRAMGWTLFMSVAAIPYYTETNPTFAGQARLALDEVFDDYAEHT
jgi:aminoglycoside phosphotransferase (APT) family kinase protein